MQRPTVIVVSDHAEVFESMRAGLDPDFEVLTMFPHAESVIAAAGALSPHAVIVDLSKRSVRCGAMTSRVVEEIPEIRLVLLLDRERNPDVKRREWLESGLERDRLSPDLALGLERALGGKVRAVNVHVRDHDDAPHGSIPEVLYSPTFSC